MIVSKPRQKKTLESRGETSGVTANEETDHCQAILQELAPFSRRSGGGQKSGLFVGDECEFSIHGFSEDEDGKLYFMGRFHRPTVYPPVNLYLFCFWDSQ